MNDNSKIELTGKQKKFCKEYIWDYNATRAAKIAGYSLKTAYSIGNENLKKPEIQAYINELQSKLAENAGISPLMVLTEHKKIAFSSIADLHNTWITRKEFEDLTEDQKASIQEIDTKIRTEYEYNPETEERDAVNVEYVRIKLFDKLRSLESINKMLGFNAPDKVESIIKINDIPNIIIERHKNTPK